jgi:hypothetical protein
MELGSRLVLEIGPRSQFGIWDLAWLCVAATDRKHLASSREAHRRCLRLHCDRLQFTTRIDRPGLQFRMRRVSPHLETLVGYHLGLSWALGDAAPHAHVAARVSYRVYVSYVYICRSIYVCILIPNHNTYISIIMYSP